MNINDVKEVVVAMDKRSDFKFIVAELTDGSGGKRLVVRANANYSHHESILLALQKEVTSSDLNADCVGGGWIRIVHAVKTISICGKSGDFGEEPDRQQTVRMLQAAFPEFQVTQDNALYY